MVAGTGYASEVASGRDHGRAGLKDEVDVDMGMGMVWAGRDMKKGGGAFRFLAGI